MLLVETVRPRHLNEIVGQDKVVKSLREYQKIPWETPHLMFYGPPGCGKTSAIHAWANEVYKEDRESSVRFVNMSGERSVQTIIKKIHAVCRYFHEKRGTRGLIVCDEADCMTSEAQEVMAYCVGLYEKRWIFCFIMNNLSKITPRLQKLCHLFRFEPIYDTKALVKRALGDSVSLEDIGKLDDYYQGDLRRVMNAAQGHFVETEDFIPEWKIDLPVEKIDRMTILRRIKAKLDVNLHELSLDDLEIILSTAVGLYRPGSILPYREVVLRYI